MFELVIFAFDDVFQACDQDVELMDRLRGKFKGMQVCMAEGEWEGIRERSWVVSSPVWDEIKSLHEPMVRGQVCILRVPVDGKNKAYLEYPNGDIEEVGFLRRVSEAEAKASIGFTRVGESYFVAKGE